MTILEAIGALLLGLGLLGAAVLAEDIWRERGLPAHNHAEGQRHGQPCPRCSLPRRPW